MSKLTINTALQIKRAAIEAYEAVVDPIKMSDYFIEESTGRMEEGAELKWKFPEFEAESAVKVLELVSAEKVVFEWEGAKGVTTKVEITFERRPEGGVLVRVAEGEMENNEEGIKWLKNNTEGWANFLACMKASLEFGINLRKGGFDFMKPPEEDEE